MCFKYKHSIELVGSLNNNNFRMAAKTFIFLISVCMISEIIIAAPDKVVCYYGTWSVYRDGNGHFTVDDISPTLCTHVIYSFVGIEATGQVVLLNPELDRDAGYLQKFAALKQKNSKLKRLVAIGGWNQGSENFSLVAASSAKRAAFIKNVINLIQTYGLDGFDIDWEYPAQRGGSSADKKNFVTLIKELRQEFDKDGLLLTAAVAAAEYSVDLSYDVPNLSKYLDLIHVMAYDLHGSWDQVTGQNAPLYASDSDRSRGWESLTVDAAIRGWIQRGAAPEKLALGIGTYGRSYTLADRSNSRIGAPVLYAGDPGPYTSESGMIGYNEIVELQKQGGWTTVWDDVQKTPYTYKGDQWIGYDNPKSVAIKVEYAKSLNLGGIMIWSIETDDFKGVSGSKYPILNTINQALGGTADENLGNGDESSQPETDPQPDEPPQDSEPTVPPVQTGEICKKEGMVRDPTDCSAFHQCISVNGQLVSLGKQSCNPGLVFDETEGACNYPSLVKC